MLPDPGESYQFDDYYDDIENSFQFTLIDNDYEAENDEVSIPYQYQPRFYQEPIWDALFPADKLVEAVRRAVLVWHRRAGKDKTCVNLILAKALEEKGLYLYLLPTQTQSRKVIWNGIGKDGIRFIDHFPDEVVAKRNNTEMTVELLNGSIIQLGGSDNYDALMGTNPLGIIFSEYSLQNPTAWEYFRPILAENGGWAVFEYTPRGKNHGFFMYKRALELSKKDNSKWFCQMLKVTDTKAIPLEAIEEERESGMSDEMVEQEFYCSFEAYNKGAIYGKQIKVAWAEKRIKHVPIVPGLPISTFWDIGVSKGSANKNTIWFAQLVDGEVHLVHYYENDDEGLPHYLAYMETWKTDHDISWGTHWAPHDINVREWTTKVKRIDAAKKAGINFREVPNIPKVDGIEASKAFISRCLFDEEQCKDGINCLTEYQYVYDELTKVYSREPLHNWAAGGSDSFRMMAVAWKDEIIQGRPKPQAQPPVNDYDIF